jgi:hypothetical protein
MDIRDDDAAGLVSFILDRYGGTEGSVSDRAAKRGAVPDHGATIVTHNGSILELRADSVTFPLRTRVGASAGDPVVSPLNVYTSMDLLAMCTWLGMDGQVPFQCPFCHCSDKEGNGAQVFRKRLVQLRKFFRHGMQRTTRQTWLRLGQGKYKRPQRRTTGTA